METAISINTFDKIRDRFIQLSNEETFIKEASFATQILSKNSYLAGLDRNSIIESVLNLVQCGLTLNPVSKFAYLVPRKGKCCLDVSYMGMIKLVTDTGSVKSIYSHIVRKDDVFEQILGTSVELIHKPKLSSKSDVIAVYAVAILNDGSKQIEVMDINEINAIRDNSESYKSFKKGDSTSCIWVNYPEEMSRKTVIKRLVKYLPKTDQWDKVNQAVELDNQDFKASYQQLDLIDELLKTTSIAPEKCEFISRTMNTYSSEDANNVISELKDKQIDRIEGGLMYSQTDIKDKVGKIK